MTALDWQVLRQRISEFSGENMGPLTVDAVGGGDINRAYRVRDGHRQFFVKTNRQDRLPMFEAEQRGLKDLAASQSLRVPRPLGCGSTESVAFIIMEYIELHGKPDASRFAQQLATLHRHTQGQFGYAIDNTIGLTVQPNSFETGWVDFWQQNRLGFQLQIAKQKGFGMALFDAGMRLFESVGLFFASYTPVPALVHGDLWSGNLSSDAAGNPVVFDPACYYGDHEVDLAMIELFANPDPQFFDAYHERFAIDPGYRQRRDLYNLYHILNHANLFGGAYVAQSKQMIARLLALL